MKLADELARPAKLIAWLIVLGGFGAFATFWYVLTTLLVEIF